MGLGKKIKTLVRILLRPFRLDLNWYGLENRVVNSTIDSKAKLKSTYHILDSTDKANLKAERFNNLFEHIGNRGFSVSTCNTYEFQILGRI